MVENTKSNLKLVLQKKRTGTIVLQCYYSIIIYLRNVKNTIWNTWNLGRESIITQYEGQVVSFHILENTLNID